MVLVTMFAAIVEKACLSVPLLGCDLDADGIVVNSERAKVLMDGLEYFYLEIISQRFVSKISLYPILPNGHVFSPRTEAKEV